MRISSIAILLLISAVFVSSGYNDSDVILDTSFSELNSIGIAIVQGVRPELRQRMMEFLLSDDRDDLENEFTGEETQEIIQVMQKVLGSQRWSDIVPENFDMNDDDLLDFGDWPMDYEDDPFGLQSQLELGSKPDKKLNVYVLEPDELGNGPLIEDGSIAQDEVINKPTETIQKDEL